MLNNRSIIMQTKEKIIEKTFALLLQKGFDGVSISDIQNYVGISRGLLYHYFGNKESLLLEATKYSLETHFPLQLSVIRELDVEHAIQYILTLYQQLTEKVSIINYDFLMYRATQESTELAEIYRETRRVELDGWRIAIENSLRLGQIREDIELEKLAQQFIYTTDGVWMRAVASPVEMDLTGSLRKALETLYKLIKK